MEETLYLERLPVIALRGLTVFPANTAHFDVGRPKSARALERAMNAHQRVFLVTQKRLDDDDPGFSDVYEVGTVAKVRQILRLPGDTVRILVEGECRARIDLALRSEPYLSARVRHLPEPDETPFTARVEAAARIAYTQFEEYIDLSQRPLNEEMVRILASRDPGLISDVIAQAAAFSFDHKQALLEEENPYRRLLHCNRLMQRELEVLRLEADMQDKVQTAMDKNQRDYYLREQLRVIHGELGEDEEADVDEYERKVRALHLPAESEEKVLREVSRLRTQGFGSAETTVIRNYLDVVLDLPWNTGTKERVDLVQAKKLLDRDHYGLEKVKERILEFLAVKQLAPQIRGQILCLVGPPGVGKTSIGMSIAKCLNRKLGRIALGGVHDEAEIRGHRKTYIGAMPGRVLSALIQAKSNNPLLLLDEIDKLGSDYRGDPASALLEVLDSEQNATFRDNFLEIPFDLSRCMFITTANTTETIPRALLDRMEVIELSSYTDEEKVMIAKNHLLPKQMARHGIKKSQLRVPDTALREIIAGYTRESGVRNLERELAAVCRKTAVRLTGENAQKRVSVSAADLEAFLGVRRYLPEHRSPEPRVGLVNGLAWTSVGGELLEVECNVVPGTGKLELTGNLGDVMKESVRAAMSYLRTRTEDFGIPADFYQTKDVHVHFPEGAIPKDGPSAGVTVCTALVSALTGIPVRGDVAMTGEISIRGRVLAIGGLKEKTMAALRSGIGTVILPKENEKDLSEIDPTVRKALNFITVRSADAVLEAALVRLPQKAQDADRPQKAQNPDRPQTDETPLPLPLPEVKNRKRKTEIRQ